MKENINEYPRVSVESVSSVFYGVSAFINRNFGLRSGGVCEAYPSFDKTFIKFCVHLRFVYRGLNK
jgi:hypothetical protein